MKNANRVYSLVGGLGVLLYFAWGMPCHGDVRTGMTSFPGAVEQGAQRHLAGVSKDEESLLDCPSGAIFSQPPAATTTLPGYSDESDNGLRAFDNFSGVEAPITGLAWWGGTISINPCTRVNDHFEVAFYTNNGGQPGALVASETFSPTAIPTGAYDGFSELLRYTVTFSEPVDLSAGWVSVYGIDDWSGCFFYWANAASGDNLAYSSAFGSMPTDFAFCLRMAPSIHSADQNGDNVISLSELLRVIQFYNAAGYHCADPPESTEDGFASGPNPAQQDCAPHNSDYNPQNWVIGLSELLRIIQFFNGEGYHACPDAEPPAEDGFCIGPPPGE